MNLKDLDKRIRAWQSDDPNNRVGFAAVGWIDQSDKEPRLSMTVHCDDLGRFAFLMLMAMTCKPELRNYLAGAIVEYDRQHPPFDPSMN